MQPHNKPSQEAPNDDEAPVAPSLRAIVSALVAVRAQIHTLQALEATLLARGDAIAGEEAEREHHTDHGELAHRALAAELAAAVRESDRSMAGKIDRAVLLVRKYPDVHRALGDATISQAHATLITDAGGIISEPEARSQYATAALEIAQVETAGRSRSLLKELAERFADRTIDERHVEAQSCRLVRVVELGDGMADLTATLSAVYAHGIRDRLNQMARAVKQHEGALAVEASREPGDSAASERVFRSMDQIRADLLTDMLLASDPNQAAASGLTGIAGIQARVQVIVPEEHVADSRQDDSADSPDPAASTDGEDDGDGARASEMTRPATLDGYGPIGTAVARQLAGQATQWERITVNPESGTVLSVDTYRPNIKLRQFLRARDLHCRFPGCHTPTSRCDVDHTIDAALGGPTTSINLAHLCRRHHTLKHHSKWTVVQQRDGTLIWTSPLGTKHSERPPSTVRFRQTKPTDGGDSGGRAGPSDTSRADHSSPF